MPADQIQYSEKYNDDTYEYRLSIKQWKETHDLFPKLMLILVIAIFSGTLYYQQIWENWSQNHTWWAKPNGATWEYNRVRDGCTTWCTGQVKTFCIHFFLQINKFLCSFSEPHILLFRRLRSDVAQPNRGGQFSNQNICVK